MLELRQNLTTLERPPMPRPAPAGLQIPGGSNPPQRVNGERHHPRKLHTPSWALLLQRFYARMARPLPPIEQLKPEQMPEPYRRLLVHSSDMTPTLETFYRARLGITLLTRELEGDEYMREVTLRPVDGGQPVEYGVIRICLDHLPASVREPVLQEQRPLGDVLRREHIPHISWPQAFFRMESDSHTQQVLRLPPSCDLYGRRNVLLDASRRLLAEVIEILAPAA